MPPRRGRDETNEKRDFAGVVDVSQSAGNLRQPRSMRYDGSSGCHKIIGSITRRNVPCGKINSPFLSTLVAQ